MTEASDFINPYEHIFREASERGINEIKVRKLIDAWFEEYVNSPDSLDELIMGVLE